MTTKWMGLWAQERQAFYAGQVIKKTDIPKYTRIVLRYNKYYEKDSNRPRFVYCFADSEGYESKCVPVEYDEESEKGAYQDDEGDYFTKGGGVKATNLRISGSFSTFSQALNPGLHIYVSLLIFFWAIKFLISCSE